MNTMVKQYNDEFSAVGPEVMLERVLARHPGKVAFSTSLGAEDQVITHLLANVDYPKKKLAKPYIFTLDTGRMFAETYEALEKTAARYALDIKVYFPDSGQVEEMVNADGINLFYYSVENRKKCCHIRKIEPLKRALAGHEIWVTGLRREQSPTRTNMAYAEWDSGNQLIKLNPILDWTEEQVWAFIKDNRIPYNTLHDKGFPSIGCQPCTRAILPGEDVRAGRWWWENPDSKECGLHPLRRD